MNLFVALSTIATLCFIQTSVLEDYDAEDLEMEMGRDLEEYDADGQDKELRGLIHRSTTSSTTSQRDNNDKYCEDGWGGHCHLPAALLFHHCDFIWNDIIPVIPEQPICRDSEKYCCVYCYAQKQYDNCGNISGLVSPTRRECCPGTVPVKTLTSGCNCCAKCKPKRNRCNKEDGRFCVKKNDPVCNTTYCLSICGGRLSSKRCWGKNCYCCLGALQNPANCGY